MAPGAWNVSDVKFRVVGLPAPMGSKVRMPNGSYQEGSAPARAKLADWRQATRTAATDWLAEHPDHTPLHEPVELSLWFYFPVVASDKYRACHVTVPDCDKLARSTIDALCHAGILADDRYVTVLHVYKYHADTASGCDVELWSRVEFEQEQRERRKAQAAATRKMAKASAS